MSPKPEPKSPQYGYGFMIFESGKRGHVVGHGRGFPGTSAILNMYLDTGYTVVVLSNYDQGSQIVMSKLDPLVPVLEK